MVITNNADKSDDMILMTMMIIKIVQNILLSVIITIAEKKS